MFQQIYLPEDSTSEVFVLSISNSNTVSEPVVELSPLQLKDSRKIQLSEIWELDKWLHLYGDFCKSQLDVQIAIK